mmetsp:Transcript_32197/g.63866  ORF Transcript_32197/g.63866 Transcript_32197/m.63866 type:complete len:221 (-) Transcript_32197:2083-2745(-)
MNCYIPSPLCFIQLWFRFQCCHTPARVSLSQTSPCPVLQHINSLHFFLPLFFFLFEEASVDAPPTWTWAVDGPCLNWPVSWPSDTAAPWGPLERFFLFAIIFLYSALSLFGSHLSGSGGGPGLFGSKFFGYRIFFLRFFFNAVAPSPPSAATPADAKAEADDEEAAAALGDPSPPSSSFLSLWRRGTPSALPVCPTGLPCSDLAILSAFSALAACILFVF